MTGPNDRNRRLQNLLDGYLTPDQEAGVRRRIAEDEVWSREFDELRALYALLDTPLDVEPPSDLLPGIEAALAADAIRRAERRRIPAPVENALVVAAVTAMAALFVVGGRFLSVESLLGRAAVGAAAAFSSIKAGFLAGVGTAVHLDWATRTLATLADAGRTVLTVASEPLLGAAALSGALTLGLGWLLLRTSSSRPAGGLSHG